MASSAPWAASWAAIPNATDCRFASPMTTPRLPRMSSPVGNWKSSAMASPQKPDGRPDTLEAAHHQTAVGAAESKAVGHHRLQRPVQAPAHDRQVFEGRVELIDMGALGDEALLHHQEAVDGFLGPGGAQA